MECLPVVEVVQIDRVEDCSGICDADGIEDFFAGFVGVVVSNHGGVVGIDGGGVE